MGRWLLAVRETRGPHSLPRCSQHAAELLTVAWLWGDMLQRSTGGGVQAADDARRAWPPLTTGTPAIGQEKLHGPPSRDLALASVRCVGRVAGLTMLL
jgi:hypothetical protein